MDQQWRAGGKQSLAEQFGALVVGDNGGQLALLEQAEDAFFRLLHADRYISRSRPAGADQGGAGIDTTRGEQANARNSSVLAWPIVTLPQARSRLCGLFSQLAVAEVNVPGMTAVASGLERLRRWMAQKKAVWHIWKCPCLVFCKACFVLNLMLLRAAELYLGLALLK